MIQQPEGLESQQVPQHIYQQASIHQMGMLKNVYRPRISHPLLVIGIALGIIVVDAIAFLLVLSLHVIDYLLVAIFFSAIAYVLYGLSNCNLRVYEFENGLIRSKGHRTSVIRWDKVELVYQENKSSIFRYLGGILGVLIIGALTRHTIYTIYYDDEAVVKLSSNGIHHLAMLGQTIQQGVTQAHMPLVTADYDHGDVIPFGPLSVSQQGISNQKDAILPWNQIKGVTIDLNVVTIMQANKVRKWVSAPIADVPNIGVLTALVNYAKQNSQ